ncbi:MAG: hypothetical protein ACI4NM_01305 [Bullifex sp.]
MDNKPKPRNIPSLLIAIAICASVIISDSMQIVLPPSIRVFALISAIALIGFYVLSNARNNNKDD